jgi:hypothetical protein
MRKRKAKKYIDVVKTEECKSVKITVNVDDDLYEAMAEAGRQHIVKDKTACFEYALNKALMEVIEEVK